MIKIMKKESYTINIFRAVATLILVALTELVSLYQLLGGTNSILVPILWTLIFIIMILISIEKEQT